MQIFQQSYVEELLNYLLVILVKNTFNQTRKEFRLWMDIVEEGYNQGETSKEILDTLFQRRPGLLESDKNHGVHQGGTHLGTVEGMLGWLRRKNAKR